jgi:hypothetical protein
VESGGKGAGFYTSIRERCKKRVGGDSEEEKITAWMTLFRIGEAEKNLASGKTKTVSVDDLIASI